MGDKQSKIDTSKQFKRQNEHIKENYKRLSVTIKKDLYSDILNKYGNEIKMNGYINGLILNDIKEDNTTDNKTDRKSVVKGKSVG